MLEHSFDLIFAFDEIVALGEEGRGGGRDNTMAPLHPLVRPTVSTTVPISCLMRLMWKVLCI